MLGYDRSVIAKAETGEHPPSEDVMKALVKALGLDQVVTRLASLARRSTGMVPEEAGAYAGLSGAFWVATAASGQQAAHLETGVQGMTVIEPTLVRNAARLFEMLRSDALPWTRSLELIAEAISRWTQLAAPGGASQVTPALTVPLAANSSANRRG